MEFKNPSSNFKKKKDFLFEFCDPYNLCFQQYNNVGKTEQESAYLKSIRPGMQGITCLNCMNFEQTKYHILKAEF